MTTKLMKSGPLLRGCVAGGLLLALAALAHGTTMETRVTGNGGAAIGNQNYKLGLTLGQAFTGQLSGATHQMGVGFWYISHSLAVSGVPDGPPAAFTTRLHQNVPNPFNPSTTIDFTVGRAGTVSLRLYDVQGRVVATLVNEEMSVGLHSLVFQPQGLASGVYLYQLKTADRVETRRLMLLK